MMCINGNRLKLDYSIYGALRYVNRVVVIKTHARAIRVVYRQNCIFVVLMVPELQIVSKRRFFIKRVSRTSIH